MSKITDADLDEAAKRVVVEMERIAEMAKNAYKDKALILPTSLARSQESLEKEFPGLEIHVSTLVPEGQVFVVNKVAVEEMLKMPPRQADFGLVTDREVSHAQA